MTEGAVRRVWDCLTCALAPLGVFAVVLTEVVRRGNFAYDFQRAYWPAARGVLEGTFRYPGSIAQALPTDPFIYPPLTAALLAPFGWLPVGVAAWTFTLAGVVSVFVALRLCGVHDWRCYGVAFLWAPVMSAVQVGNLSLLIVLLVAVLWRFRDRWLAAAIAAAIVVSLKLFLWPLVLWLLFTRRIRAAIAAAAIALVANAAAWLALEPGSVTGYTRLLHGVSELEGPSSYTPAALARSLSLPYAGVAGYALGAALVALAWRRRDEANVCLALITVAALVTSPIVWLHYLSILLVPVAVMRPKLSALWLLPVALWLCPGGGNGTAAQTAVGVAVVLAVAAAALGRSAAADPVVRPQRERRLLLAPRARVANE